MRKVIKLSVLMVLMCVAFSVNAKSSNVQDVLYLNNGSIIKGSVVEQIPNESVKIQTADGSVFVYDAAQVQKLTKEEFQLPTSMSVGYKNPTLSGVCSLLVPGLGQFVNGNNGAGWGFLCAGFVFNTGYLTCLLTGNEDAAATGAAIFGLASLGNTIWSICHAVSGAKKFNREHGLQVMNVGENSNLYINPDIQLRNDYALGNSKIEPSFGAKMTLAF